MAREHDFIFGSSDFIVGQKHFWATSNSEAATSLPEMTVFIYEKKKKTFAFAKIFLPKLICLLSFCFIVLTKIHVELRCFHDCGNRRYAGRQALKRHLEAAHGMVLSRCSIPGPKKPNPICSASQVTTTKMFFGCPCCSDCFPQLDALRDYMYDVHCQW